MSKNNHTEDDVKSSVHSIYSSLLEKRLQEREQKEIERMERQEKKREEKEKKNKKEDGTKLSKKEKRERDLDNWKEVLYGLTGDDLEYSDEKKRKKKYKKWISDDITSDITVAKPKKPKKKNFQKEFNAELNMLKNLVADQNRFTIELQKRFQNMAGPNTKDAMPLNKTMVDLAAAVNASRSNSLGYLREIGNLKKNIADLYMRQKKLDSELGGSSSVGDSNDLGLLGSSIASSLFGDTSSQFAQPPVQPPVQQPMQSNVNITTSSGPDSYNPNGFYQVTGTRPNTPQASNSVLSNNFDPSTWDGPELDSSNSVIYENIPKKYVVEWHKDEDKARFKAINTNTGEEIIGCPTPEADPKRLVFNEKDKTVKGQFDEIYELEVM